MSLAEFLLVCARPFVYLLAIVIILLYSPVSELLLKPSPLSIAIAVATVYIPVASYLEAKKITWKSPKVNKSLYAIDMALLGWGVYASGGISSPIYSFLYLPIPLSPFYHLCCHRFDYSSYYRFSSRSAKVNGEKN